MNLHVLPQRMWVNVGYVTTLNLTVVGLVTGTDMGVFLLIPAIGKLPVTAIKSTFERLFPCMSAPVDPCMERPLQSRGGCSTSVHHEVIHQHMHRAAGHCWPGVAGQSSHLIRTTVRMEEGPS